MRRLFNARKGQSLLDNVQSLIIAGIIIALAIVALTKYCNISQSDLEKNQASGTLEAFSNFLESMKDGEQNIFTIYVPKGSYFMTFNAQESAISQCFGDYCACICKDEFCKDKNSICRVLKLPIGKFNGTIRTESISATRTASSYSIASAISDTKDDPVTIIEGKCSSNMISIEDGKMLSETVVPLLENAKMAARAQGIELRVTSAYRTKDEQRYLFENIKGVEVCNPDSGNGICPHMTGCTVDVCFGKLCETNPGTLNNTDTQLLNKIMTDAGFVNYNREYWHFEYGTARWLAANPADVQIPEGNPTFV